MKARLKATGRIIQVMNVMDEKGNGVWEEISDMTNHGPLYSYDELEFLDIPKGMQKGKKAEPDYWEKLKHQYAGMAMQGMLSDKEMFNAITEGVWPPNRPAYIATRCDEYATALINRLKEENNESE